MDTAFWFYKYGFIPRMVPIPYSDSDREIFHRISGKMAEFYGSRSPYEKAKIVTKFIHRNFTYSFERDENGAGLVPPHTLVRTRKGICRDFCVLMSGILDAWGVDYRIVLLESTIVEKSYHLVCKVDDVYFDPTTGKIWSSTVPSGYSVVYHYPDVYKLYDLN